MIRIDSVTQYVVIAGLVGAIVWDLLTWWWGLPTSSSHALIGGYAGAAVMRSGFHVIIAAGWSKTLIFIVVAPIMGLVLGLTFMVAVFWLCETSLRGALMPGSGGYNWSLPRSTAWATEGTTPRRRWASSPVLCMAQN